MMEHVPMPVPPPETKAARRKASQRRTGEAREKERCAPTRFLTEKRREARRCEELIAVAGVVRRKQEAAAGSTSQVECRPSRLDARPPMLATRLTDLRRVRQRRALVPALFDTLERSFNEHEHRQQAHSQARGGE